MCENSAFYAIIFFMVELYKEKLIFYRLLLTFAITAMSGCLAWIFTQYSICTTLQIIVNSTVILFLGIFISKTVMSINFYHKKIKETINAG